MLTKKNRQPRSLWWIYKSYGDLAGQLVEVVQGNTVDGVVATDNSTDIIKAVIGPCRDRSEPILIRFQGIEDQFNSAQVGAERIRIQKINHLKIQR